MRPYKYSAGFFEPTNPCIAACMHWCIHTYIHIYIHTYQSLYRSFTAVRGEASRHKAIPSLHLEPWSHRGIPLQSPRFTSLSAIWSQKASLSHTRTHSLCVFLAFTSVRAIEACGANALRSHKFTAVRAIEAFRFNSVRGIDLYSHRFSLEF